MFAPKYGIPIYPNRRAGDFGSRLIGLICIFIAIVFLLASLHGCANQAAQLHPQLVAADAAVVSGRTLLATGGLSKDNARRLSRDAHIVDAGFQAALESIDLNQSPTATVSSQILTSLAALAQDLESTPQAKALGEAVRRKRAALQASGRKSLTAGEVVALINLVVQLTPVVISEVDSVFSGRNVTPADCKAALEKFQADLSQLDAALNG